MHPNTAKGDVVPPESDPCSYKLTSTLCVDIKTGGAPAPSFPPGATLLDKGDVLTSGYISPPAVVGTTTKVSGGTGDGF